MARRRERGTAYLTDDTPGNDLFQSETVAVGEYAFHLANPDFATSGFSIDQDLAVTSDTQLFFLSQLRAATSDQIAQVRLSLDGGSSWPTTVYSQPGIGFPGEGSFSLRETSLAEYAGQDVRLRFQLDFSGGSAFTGADTRSGWLIDDIQIGSEYQKQQFSIGDPSPVEQEYLEYINRARADALAEANRLRTEPTASIQNAYNFFGVNPDDIVSQYQYYVDQDCIAQHAQPLSFNEQLLLVSDLHTQDMFENQTQSHTSSSNPPAPLQARDTFGQRLDRVGYVGAAGENIFSYSESTANGHAGFAVDWGNSQNPSGACYSPAFAGQGMQNPAGHRINIHDGSFKEAGIGVIEGSNGSVGPQVVTQNFGNPGNVSYITGVVYEDANGNQFYEVGEGRGGIRVDVEGSPYFAVSTDSGAYSIPVSEDGDYLVTFQGDGIEGSQLVVEIRDGLNSKQDYLVRYAGLACDFDNDELCTTSDLYLLYAVGELNAGVEVTLAIESQDLNSDQVIDLGDLALWLEGAAESNGFGEAYLPGDTELDGDVDFADFLSLSGTFGSMGDWSQGNFNGDSSVDFADFLQLSGNFGKSIPRAAETVPEPKTQPVHLIGLLLVANAAWQRRRSVHFLAGK